MKGLTVKKLDKFTDFMYIGCWILCLLSVGVQLWLDHNFFNLFQTFNTGVLCLITGYRIGKKPMDRLIDWLRKQPSVKVEEKND